MPGLNIWRTLYNVYMYKNNLVGIFIFESEISAHFGPLDVMRHKFFSTCYNSNWEIFTKYNISLWRTKSFRRHMKCTQGVTANFAGWVFLEFLRRYDNGSYKGVIKREAVYKCTNKDYLPRRRRGLMIILPARWSRAKEKCIAHERSECRQGIYWHE